MEMATSKMHILATPLKIGGSDLENSLVHLEDIKKVYHQNN